MSHVCRIYAACMPHVLHVCRIYVVCVCQHVCCMHVAACMSYVCRICVAYMLSVCHMYVASMLHVCCVYVAHMLHVCRMHATCMSPVCHMYIRMYVACMLQASHNVSRKFVAWMMDVRARKYLRVVDFFSLRIGVFTLKLCTEIQETWSFRHPLSPYNAEHQVWISFSDQVGVQTHLMMGVGDVQAVRRGAQHSVAQLDQKKIFTHGLLHCRAWKESKRSSLMNASA